MVEKEKDIVPREHDLVQRLHYDADFIENLRHLGLQRKLRTEITADLRESADEIERLREELALSQRYHDEIQKRNFEKARGALGAGRGIDASEKLARAQTLADARKREREAN